MSKDPHFIENENSLVKCCKQVSLWDTSRVAALLMKTSVINFVMIATFKSEDTGILNRSKIKASISVQTMVTWKGEGIGCILLKGLRFWHHHHSNPISMIQLFQLMLSERPHCYVSWCSNNVFSFSLYLVLKSVQLSLIPSLVIL